MNRQPVITAETRHICAQAAYIIHKHDHILHNEIN